MMRCLFCLVLLFCRLCFPQYQAVTLSDFLPPPLSVTCSKPENRVYQRQDNDLRISCLWDGYIVMQYSRVNSGKEINHGKEEPDFQSPPYCQWYRDSILVNTTNHWSGHLTLGSGLTGEGPHPPWAYSQITVQCTSAMCEAPLCFYHNLSIQVSGQDVRLFLFWPHTVPVFEWQPVQLGWCARLKSSTWIYHFRSRKGSPADILIPSNQYSDPPPFAAYPNAELYQVCRSYYNYHLTVRYPRRGIHTASVSIEDGPPISLSMDFFVEPALLHVFSANSKLLSHPHGTLHLSWRFLPLSQGTVTYKLLDMQGRRGWSHTYNYNPFSLHSNFCAVHTPHNSKEKVVASIYFHTNENLTEELTGKLDFSNETLIFSASSAAPIYLTLNPAKIKLGTYIVSHTLGLFYSTQESATGNNSSSHYIFYQQASFSYLFIAEFLQLQLFRFSMHIYLNRNGTLFKSLGEKEIDIHVFNSSSLEERLFYIVWFIPVQHPLLQCEWTFNLQLFDSRVKYPIQNDTFTYLDQVRNATHFIPDSYLPFNPAMYTGFVAKVKCTSNYSMPITLKATFNTYASKIIESRIACQYQHCSITDINIQKSSTSKHIMHYTQGTEFTVTADTQINCPGQKQTHIVWNIYKVPNMAHTPNWSKPFNPPGIGKRNVATLKVPSSSLDCGLYLFNFTMKLTSLDTWDTKIASDSVFIEIGPDNLVAVIDGGNFRTVRFSEQWTLNGSAFSNGNAIQPSEELTFTWYCTKQKTDYISMTLSRNKKCHPDQSHPIVRDRTTKIVRIALFAAECLDLVGIQSQWKEGTCSLGRQTSWSKIHCICEAREPTTRKAIPRPAETSGIRFLASKVALFPSQVDKERSLLSETGQNPVTWWTVFAIFITYIFLAIYVLGKDKIRKRDCIIDLPDNDPFDKTRYLLTIYTGSRLRAGTQATVFIQLTGQNGVSDVHQLKHPLFPRNFRRGAINTFLLTTEMDLGELSSLHVWHNNCYFGSNWYLSRVKVQNTDTKQSWLFMCRKWFALGKDDCQIERTFPVTNPNVPLSTIDTFLIMVSHGLSNDHLWLSVFAHSIDDSFSRFQRLSCCLAILLSSLVFNIMFFSIEYEQHVHLVDLQTLRSIRIGIQSALMSIPVELIVTTLFKYSVKKHSWCNRDPQVKEKSSFLSESSSKEASLKDAPLTKKKSKPFSLMDLNANNNAAKKETFSEKIQKPQLLLCFLVIAWSFVFCTSGLSSFFIILHGLSYDEKTSFEWLIASLTSFCLSVFLFETVKIVAISAWNTGSAKFCAKLPWLRYPDIQFHGRIMTMEEMAQSHRELLRLRASKQYQPINEEELTVLRRIEKIKNLGYIFVKNMLCHLVFLTLILNATHPAEITNSFYYNQLMYNRFSVGLSKVHTIEDIYNWVKDIFVPLIHNEYQPTYLLNTWSKVLGLPRMRQIRSTDSISTCYFPHGLANTYILSGTHCQKKYGIDPEDQTNYFGSWAMPVNSSVPNDSSGFLGFTFEHPTTQWEYNSYGELNSYPSRGYSFYFFPGEPKANSTTRLKTLETSNWLDDKTWALIVELTTFNPDADLFCSISIIFESSDIGSVNSSVSVHSYRLPLFSDQSKSQILLLLGTIYMLIVYIADECRVLYQKRLRYISTAANIINFGIKTTCTVFLVLLLFKFKLAFDLVQFYLQHQERFIPFHAVSQFDQVIRIIMGFLAFLLVLKMYRYFRFLYGVRLAQKSLYAAIPTMINLSIAGGIFFFAYMSLGYLGFGQHEWNFHNVIYSFSTILSYCALAFRNTEFSSDEFLGGLFLGSFMVVMICVFVNLSQVILISSHVDMKIPVYEHHSHEAEIIYYIVQKIYRGWFFATTGSQTTTETHIFNRLLFGKPRRTFRLLD
nr:polycystic kidney disease and receptor for egg jelly-related protein-like isoform X2 [Pogona vitticeps]